MFPLLNGSGFVAHQEGALMIEATLLMLIVVVPVLCLLFFFAWWYRAGNTKAKYMPDWQHSRLDEMVWWAVPFEIVLVISALTWTSSHALDPRKSLALASSTPPIVIEAVALPHNWLFIYPAQGVATVNYLEVPAGAPLRFEVTADAPMNSLWIPALGGQIYAMTGMVNTLNLVADAPRTYPGMSANYSGDGFANLRFDVRATTTEAFSAWVATARQATTTKLDHDQYVGLQYPETIHPGYYGAIDPMLFASILNSFDAGMRGMHH